MVSKNLTILGGNSTFELGRVISSISIVENNLYACEWMRGGIPDPVILGVVGAWDALLDLDLFDLRDELDNMVKLVCILEPSFC